MSQNSQWNHGVLFQKHIDASHHSTYSIGYKRNEERMLENDSLVKLLSVLVTHPYAISFIEQEWADELERLNYFSLEEFAVTAAGRDFLATHADHLTND